MLSALRNLLLGKHLAVSLLTSALLVTKAMTVVRCAELCAISITLNTNQEELTMISFRNSWLKSDNRSKPSPKELTGTTLI